MYNKNEFDVFTHIYPKTSEYLKSLAEDESHLDLHDINIIDPLISNFFQEINDDDYADLVLEPSFKKTLTAIYTRSFPIIFIGSTLAEIIRNNFASTFKGVFEEYQQQALDAELNQNSDIDDAIKEFKQQIWPKSPDFIIKV